MLKDVARLDNCVTVIDACNFDATFNTGDFLSDRFEVDNPDDDRTVVHLMIDQIEFANIIVLNKVDMVKPADLERIKKEGFQTMIRIFHFWFLNWPFHPKNP